MDFTFDDTMPELTLEPELEPAAEIVPVQPEPPKPKAEEPVLTPAEQQMVANFAAKIDRIELVVRRIFERAKACPEVIPDLKKLMDYYLPMTVKLLNAYAEMDAQPVQSERIAASKREIEQTLDTLNLAFEKMLDDLFSDTILDISSDITVLNTMLAREGLTEDELTKMRKQQNLS